MEEGSGPLEAGERSTASPHSSRGVNRRLSILDSILRVVAALGTLGSAVAMGTAKETLPFFTMFALFSAEYKDLPSFTFFVVANSVVCAYLFLSLPLSILHIIRGAAVNSTIVLITFDTMMLAVLTSGASAAAAIVYLSHKGNSSANWFAICQQFNNFCHRVSGSLIGSFVGVVLLILAIILSSMAAARATKKAIIA